MSIDPRSIDPRAFGVPDHDPDDAAQAQAEERARAMWPRDAASRALGMRLDEIGPDRAEMLMTVRPDMLNPHACCHGGFIFALADSCCGYACNASNSTEEATLTTGCSIDYLHPAREGDVLRAVAEARARGGRSGIYDVTVFNQDGRTIALFRGKSRTVPAHAATDGPADPAP